MTAPEQTRRCWRGPRCAAAHREGDELVGAPADRPLCDTCERAVAQVLDETPALYVACRRATLTRDVGAKASDYVKRSAGSPMPLNARALDLGEQVAWLLTTWEEIVRDIAGLTPYDPTGRREGPRVTDAAHLLAGHLTAWINAPTTILATSRWTDDTEQSGVSSAAALLDWKQAVRRALGQTKLITRRDEPCMYCQVRAVVVHNGDDHVRCENCHRTWDRDQYLTLVRGFAPYLEQLGAAG